MSAHLRKTRLDTRPTTEDPTNRDAAQGSTPPEHPAWLGVKSGVRLPEKVTDLRRKLYQKAKQEPKFRFYALYDRVTRLDVLTAAWQITLAKDKGPGIDGIRCQDIIDAPGGVAAFLEQLQSSLVTRTYRPDPVKRVYIDKPDGRKRPLGIPILRDRVVQTAALLILEAIFEADFYHTSYGFRPERSAADALATIRGHLESGYTSVYDADLKGYFDTIPHAKLLLAVRHRVTDGAVLHLIKLWLRCEVVEEDANGHRQSSRPTAGTPQGGVISPLLSNIYLHWFEHLFLRRDGPAHWAKAKITRYADDFVIQARYVGTRLSGWIESVLENRFQLQINREKTKIVQLGPAGQPLDFLGYTFRYDRDLYGRRNHYLNLFPSRKALKKAREKIASLTGPERCFQPITALIAEINAWSRGWSAYFAIGYPRQAKREIFRYIAERLTRHLKRRSQRAYRPPEGTSFYAHLQALGLKRL